MSNNGNHLRLSPVCESTLGNGAGVGSGLGGRAVSTGFGSFNSSTKLLGKTPFAFPIFPLIHPSSSSSSSKISTICECIIVVLFNLITPEYSIYTSVWLSFNYIV